jgi:hypothetical protein
LRSYGTAPQVPQVQLLRISDLPCVMQVCECVPKKDIAQLRSLLSGGCLTAESAAEVTNILTLIDSHDPHAPVPPNSSLQPADTSLCNAAAALSVGTASRSRKTRKPGNKRASRVCGNPDCSATREACQKMDQCAACEAVSYCGRECQKANWRAHKLTCKPLQSQDPVPAAAQRQSEPRLEKL